MRAPLAQLARPGEQAGSKTGKKQQEGRAAGACSRTADDARSGPRSGCASVNGPAEHWVACPRPLNLRSSILSGLIPLKSGEEVTEGETQDS